MSQATMALPTTGVVSGLNMTQNTNNALAALNSNHLGASRPASAVDGTVWHKDVSATVREVYYFDGVDDILMGVVNPTANTWNPSVSLATLAAHAPRASQLTNQKVIPVNGCCMVDQINNGALITPTNGSYPIDNVSFMASQASKLQSQRITTALDTLHASHALRYSVLAQYAPVAADYFLESHPIEGIDIANWQWGTSNAKNVSLQFKVRASVSGTYSGALRNVTANRSYPFSFVLSANTDTLVKIEGIAGDTVGAIPTGEVCGLYITFDLGSGANYHGTGGAWATANYVGVTGSTALVAQANGSTLDITDVYINEGSFCLEFPRQRKADVLRDCQRYLFDYPATGTNIHGMNYSLAGGAIAEASFPVPMRTQPTLTITLGAGTTGVMQIAKERFVHVFNAGGYITAYRADARI